MRLKTFFISFILSTLVFWGMDVFIGRLENFLFFQEIAKNPEILTAQISRPEFFYPTPILKTGELTINTNSAISVWFDNLGHQKVLFRKDSNKKLPIASLTKLMTAYVVLEYYDISRVIKIPKKTVVEDENFGWFKIGESFSIESLLYSLLMESNNSAAAALSEVIGEDAFVELMNLEAKKVLGPNYQNTIFVNSTGLDSKESNGEVNYSTTQDLVKLTISFLKEQPLIWEILGHKEFDLYTSDGIFHHKIFNTNELLGKTPEIIGGKTGETQQAGGCLLLVLRAPNNQGFLINFILGSEDRFREMEKLIDWLKVAYQW